MWVWRGTEGGVRGRGGRGNGVMRGLDEYDV